MIDDVIFKSIRSDGKFLIFGGSNSDWMIPSNGLSGIDYPKTNLYSNSNAVGDGMNISGKNIESRTVKLKAIVKNAALNSIMRKNIISFFNSKYTYSNFVTYQGVTRWINAEIDGFSCPSENIYKPCELTATFFSANPYWRSVDSFGKDIAGITSSWGFPWIDTSTIKPKPSLYNFAQSIDITNDGDVETYCVVVIKAKGPVINPIISNGTNYVKLLTSLIKDDVVIIDFENKTITKNAVNVINYVDKTSSFTSMQLNVGDNSVSFNADDGQEDMSVTIYYNKLYMGI